MIIATIVLAGLQIFPPSHAIPCWAVKKAVARIWRRGCGVLGAGQGFSDKEIKQLNDASGNFEALCHWIAACRAEFGTGGPVFRIPSGEVKSPRGFGALKRASRVAALHRTAFKRAQQCGTDAAKAGVRRNVIQRNLAGVGDAADREYIAILNCDKKRIFRFDPCPEYFRGFVAQPSPQNFRVIVVIGSAQLCDHRRMVWQAAGASSETASRIIIAISFSKSGRPATRYLQKKTS